MLHTAAQELARTSGISVDECRDEDCTPHLMKAGDYFVLLVNASRKDAYEIAQKYHFSQSLGQVIFVLSERVQPRLLESLTSTDQVSNSWVIAQRTVSDLERVFSDALRASAQRQRYRTTI